MVDQIVADTEIVPETQPAPEIKAEDKTIVVADTEKMGIKGWIADDWREKIAGSDAKELARLQRFPDVQSVYKSFRELEGKVSSSEVKFGLPDKPTEEQVAKYRKDNNIPEKAEDYVITLPNGVEVGPADELFISHMQEVMHSENLPASVVNNVINELFVAKEAEQARLEEGQKVMRFTSEETLRGEWGGNYIPNIMAVKNLIASAPEAVRENILSAKLPDGNVLGSDADTIRWLASIAVELNPAGTVVPGGGANQMQAIDQELNTLNELMGKNIQAWHKNPIAKARHRELLTAKDKLQGRGY